MRHRERFDPREETGTLIDSEHRGRYHWASQMVAGKEVLDAGCGVGYGIEILAAAGAAAVSGADLDPGAVATSRERVGERAAAIVEADLRELPFEDESFDSVVCFETIEHIEGAERALAEMRRVLRPDGVVVVSSPNPDVYIEGNEHHVHEFRPEELAATVGAHFSQVAEYRQDAWLGTTIESASAESALGKTLRTSDRSAEAPTYGIVVGSDSALPELASLAAFGNSFDLRWWSEQLAASKGETVAAREREAQTQKRLEETATSLLEANQELAQIPLLRHRLAELEKLHADLSTEYHGILGSKSWRITAPLRRSRASS
jgi:2-polyprenyl-3-methyl-5-hydroxy-6-metoxy-1,4-benzoquinol methylase